MVYGNQTQQYGQVPYNQGFNYGGMQAPRRSSVLTYEQIATLRQKGAGFTLALTKEEVLRGQCTHINEQGQPAYVTNPDGTVTCTICGHTWKSADLSNEDVERAVQTVLDIMQTVKLMYINMPEQAAREYWQTIPLIEKLPKLYQVAADNFRSYEGNYAGYMNGQMSPFAMFNTFAGGQYANAYQYNMTQPQQPYGYNAQGFAPQQPYNAAPVQPAYPGQPVNPFDANSQAYGYTPGTPAGYAYNPGQPAPQVAPAQPAPAPAAPAQPAAAPAEANATSNGNHTP